MGSNNYRWQNPARFFKSLPDSSIVSGYYSLTHSASSCRRYYSKLLMHDNSCPHITRFVSNWLEEGIQVLP